jgi:hypothetical protein
MELEISLLCHKNLPLNPILRYINPDHILIPYFINIYFNIIIPSVLTIACLPSNILEAFLFRPILVLMLCVLISLILLDEGHKL